MFNSITFPEEGQGYLYKKYQKPVAPKKNDSKYWDWARDEKDRFGSYKRVFNQSQYDKDHAEYKEDLAIYQQHKGQYLVPCAPLLVGHTFHFEPNKINIIFGPNGCGKTTILKALAAHAFIEMDGYSKPMDYFDLTANIPEELKDTPTGKRLRGFDATRSDLLKMIPFAQVKWSGNSTAVDWDGGFTFYHNFDARAQRGVAEIGGMVGGIFSNYGDEFHWRMTERSVSLGQKTLIMFQRLVSIAQHQGRTSSIMEFRKGYKAHDVQKEYLSTLPNFDKDVPATFLFDELDKSLDIRNIWGLYLNAFPALIEKYGVQIIAISHSPWILSSAIWDNPNYNIINVDPQYTEETRKLLNGVHF